MTASELTGVINGHIVDSKVLRGGDISPIGIECLKRIGVTRIISLKSDIVAEKFWVESAGMIFVSRPLNNNGRFSYDDIKLVPEILDQITWSDGKILIHCHHGSDRTGVVIGCYRIRSYAWPIEDVLKEMKLYGNAWYNFGMRHAVREFAEDFFRKNPGGVPAVNP